MHTTMHLLLPTAPTPPLTGFTYASTPSPSLLAPTTFSLSTTPTPLRNSRFYLQSHYADFYVIPAPVSPVTPPCITPPPPRSTSPDLGRFKKPRFSKRLNSLWVEREKGVRGGEMVEVRLVSAREVHVEDVEKGRREGKGGRGVVKRLTGVERRVWVMICVLVVAGGLVFTAALLAVLWKA